MNDISLSGQFYQARSAQHTHEQIILTGNGRVRLYSDKFEALDVALEEVDVSSKLGNTPRQFIFPDGQLFIFEGNQQVEQWLASHGRASIISKFESSKRFIFIGLVLVPFMLFGIYRYAIPNIAIHFSHIIPNAVIVTSSQHTLKTLDRIFLEPSQLDKDIQTAHILDWQTKIDALLGNSEKYQFKFRASEKMGANAFALPDGTIVLTDDLMGLMEEHEDALFAIILHEIGHVELNHSMRYIAETLATSVLVNYMFGDVSGIIDLFVGMSATMVDNQFSQKLEWQADDFAINTLKANNLSTESFAKAMELFLKDVEESQLDHLFSTHPLLKERAQNARASMNSNAKD